MGLPCEAKLSGQGFYKRLRACSAGPDSQEFMVTGFRGISGFRGSFLAGSGRIRSLGFRAWRFGVTHEAVMLRVVSVQ